MKNSIRNLLLASCLLFAASYDCCTWGVNYDKRRKLYPEPVFTGCMLVTSYGQRWERLGFSAFSLGTVLSITSFLIWRRNKQAEEKLSILIKEE